MQLDMCTIVLSIIWVAESLNHKTISYTSRAQGFIFCRTICLITAVQKELKYKASCYLMCLFKQDSEMHCNADFYDLNFTIQSFG